MFVWAALNYYWLGRKRSTICSKTLSNFPCKLWHILKCSAFVLKIETVVHFLHPRPFCLQIFFFFFASVPIPQSLLTVCYWSGSWYLNWSIYSATCLRYPTWAISLNNVFINWLIITVRLISCIYIWVLSTTDLSSNNHAYLSRSCVLHYNLIIIEVENNGVCVQTLSRCRALKVGLVKLLLLFLRKTDSSLPQKVQYRQWTKFCQPGRSDWVCQSCPGFQAVAAGWGRVREPNGSMPLSPFL